MKKLWVWRTDFDLMLAFGSRSVFNCGVVGWHAGWVASSAETDHWHEGCFSVTVKTTCKWDNCSISFRLKTQIENIAVRIIRIRLSAALIYEKVWITSGPTVYRSWMFENVKTHLWVLIKWDTTCFRGASIVGVLLNFRMSQANFPLLPVCK